ncbi:MAG TPA: ParB N-terminal domain-containing protein [Pirellulaceae bacterium]|nr:ParB N-terminal domain-containing protein [Pirellulaceae bacterium]
MSFRDRIREFRRVPAAQLRPNPRNWRTHPAQQRAALQGILTEVGYADALLARELEDGSLELIDGHLRAELTPGQLLPVLILDIDATEADKLLAVFDPLAAQAESDLTRLRALLDEIDFHSPELAKLTSELLAAASQVAPTTNDVAELQLPTAFQLVIECPDEFQQQALFARLTDEGWACRVITL